MAPAVVKTWKGKGAPYRDPKELFLWDQTSLHFFFRQKEVTLPFTYGFLFWLRRKASQRLGGGVTLRVQASPERGFSTAALPRLPASHPVRLWPSGRLAPNQTHPISGKEVGHTSSLSCLRRQTEGSLAPAPATRGPAAALPKALTRGWSLEMGKKRRLKLSATSTACRGGGGSSSAARAVPPPPPPPPGPQTLRLLARLGTAPGDTTTGVAIFSHRRHFRTETDTARGRGQKAPGAQNAEWRRREGGEGRGECACASPRRQPRREASWFGAGSGRGRREPDLLKRWGWGRMDRRLDLRA